MHNLVCIQSASFKRGFLIYLDSMMVKKENILHALHSDRRFGVDYRFEADGVKKPVILFVHGFKGFKDAMHFNVMADQMAATGFVFMKMNLSHNGVTPEHPMDFVDLEAFGQNNFTKELDDISVALDAIEAQKLGIPAEEFDIENIFLIGHSRGGSVSILKACEDSRVKKVVSWAAVPDLASFLSIDFVKEWKEKGVQYIKNGRTHQDMPMYYQMAEDFEANRERFDISIQLKRLKVPFKAIHGDEDETVPVESLLLFKQHYPAVQTHRIVGASHTFGGKHPWESNELPAHSTELINETIHFLKS